MKIADNKVRTLRSYFQEELSGLYDEGEIQQFAYMAFEFYFGWSRAELQLNIENQLSESEILKIHFCIKSLKKQVPIQYILGEAEFCDMRLKVNQDVLIPRPETEEIVAWIADDFAGKSPTIIDIGTGSGAIALALQKAVPNSKVFGMDVSSKALDVANENKEAIESQVEFQLSDIMSDDFSWALHEYDVIVSNPPYIGEAEGIEMDANVLNYEPHLALFVPDGDPLLFYTQISAFAFKRLCPGGRLYFEINRQYGKEIIANLEQHGFKDVTLRKDINDNDRMIAATR
jgi:release factor glutamine methyltransferase